MQEKLWTVARCSIPRPKYLSNLKITVLAALRTVPVFGRILATTGCWNSSHYLHDKVVDGVSCAKLGI
jgi:hypothetical protein